MQREAAETVGVQALGWLAGNDDLLPVFLGSTGASLDDLRAGAGDAAFLGSVLDFVMMDDAWVVAFCDAAGIAYTAPMQARAALPGGAVTHWT
jgi:hypothetical protein